MESKKYTKLWKGKTIMSFGSNRSRGVGILFSSTLNFELESFNYDFEGRVICADITLVNTKLRLINVYTPNIPSERRQFIKNLQAYLITSREIIMGGYWNCIEDLSLDKMAGDEHRGFDGAKELLQLRNDFYLKDMFRIKYPKQCQFSYRKGPINVRLDRFYMYDSLLPCIKDIKHTPCSISDHYYVDLLSKKLFVIKINMAQDIGDVMFLYHQIQMYIRKLNRYITLSLNLISLKMGIGGNVVNVLFVKLLLNIPG